MRERVAAELAFEENAAQRGPRERREFERRFERPLVCLGAGEDDDRAADALPIETALELQIAHRTIITGHGACSATRLAVEPSRWSRRKWPRWPITTRS